MKRTGKQTKKYYPRLYSKSKINAWLYPWREARTTIKPLYAFYLTKTYNLNDCNVARISQNIWWNKKFIINIKQNKMNKLYMWKLLEQMHAKKYAEATFWNRTTELHFRLPNEMKSLFYTKIKLKDLERCKLIMDTMNRKWSHIYWAQKLNSLYSKTKMFVDFIKFKTFYSRYLVFLCWKEFARIYNRKNQYLRAKKKNWFQIKELGKSEKKKVYAKLEFFDKRLVKILLKINHTIEKVLERKDLHRKKIIYKKNHFKFSKIKKTTINPVYAFGLIKTYDMDMYGFDDAIKHKAAKIWFKPTHKKSFGVLFKYVDGYNFKNKITLWRLYEKVITKKYTNKLVWSKFKKRYHTLPKFMNYCFWCVRVPKSNSGEKPEPYESILVGDFPQLNIDYLNTVKLYKKKKHKIKSAYGRNMLYLAWNQIITLYSKKHKMMVATKKKWLKKEPSENNKDTLLTSLGNYDYRLRKVFKKIKAILNE